LRSGTECDIMAVEIVESRRSGNYPGREMNLTGGSPMDSLSPKSPPYNLCTKCGEAPRIYDRQLCRVCWNAYMRSRYSYDQERDRQLYANYGISLDEYNALSHAQDDVCAICKQPERNRRGCKKRTENIVPMLHVDHDHVTGKIRGLLCGECNTALGMLREDPKRIKALLKYLKDRPE